MDSRIKLVEMSKRDMDLLRTTAIIAALISVTIASITVGVLSFTSMQTKENTVLPLQAPHWLLYTETVFGLAILLISLAALTSRVSKSKRSAEGDEEEEEVLILQQRATTSPLLAAVLLSLPFRGVAEITSDNNVPNLFLLLCADTANAFGIATVLCYLWMYPFLCGQARIPLREENMQVESRKLPLLQISVCTFYALLRVVIAFALQVHLSPFPLQNLFAMFGMFIQKAWSDIDLWDTIATLGLSLTELVILFGIMWNLRIYSRLLLNAADPASYQIIIALRYFQQSSLLFVFNVVFVDLVTAFVSPEQTKFIHRETANLILSQPLGHTAVSVAVVALALREFYVHHAWKDSGVVAGLWGFMSTVMPGDSPRRRNDLVYRVSDERNPLTELPVPQKNIFSLETATLLFNIAWLVTTYGAGAHPKVPADFGRPKYSLHSRIAHRDGKVGAIILQGLDRIIIAFKPVSTEDLKHSYLLPLSKTFLGHSLSGKTMELDVLKVRQLSARDSRLFRRSKVHAGFETVYSALQGQILRDVSFLLREKQRPIFVTGYGSGGAVANLCVLDLHFRRFVDQGRLNSVYTFGAMKVMNSPMVQLFQNHVPYRWRCVVSGDSTSVQPISSSFKHPSKVATFTRNGHLAIEYNRTCKWWQAPISVHPMHKLSAYFCALENWHSAFHIKRPIDLWNWPVDSAIRTLFKQEALFRDSRWPMDTTLDSPTPDIESRSVRKLDSYFTQSVDSEAEDVIAYAR